MKYHYKYEKQKLRREDNTNILKDAITEMWQRYKLQDKLTEIDLKSFWNALLGEKVSEKTERVSLYKNKLFIKLNSPALKQDLMMQKTDIYTQINQSYPQAGIEDIIFL